MSRWDAGSKARWSPLLLALLLGGCAAVEDPEPQRWIPEEPEETLSIEHLAAASPAEVRQTAARPWKVDLGNDVRNALLSVSGDSFDQEITTVPAAGRLRLAYGVACGTPGDFPRVAPVRLQALVERRGGDRETVWEARLEAADGGRAERWNEAEIDLSDYDGRPVTISLQTTTAAEPSQRPPCLVALANPEVTGGSTRQRAPNVLLISVDTLRAGSLSLYGNSRQTTPAIDAWARGQGTTFAAAVAQSAWTLPSHVSMFTGLDALDHGVNFNSPAPSALTSVAEVFRQAGYGTFAVTGGGWMSPQYGFSQGFDRYAYWPGGDGERELQENMDRFLEQLAGHANRRFFALFHTYEPHGPYRPRQPYFDRFYDGPLKDRVENVQWRPPRPNTGVVDRRVELVWRQRPGEMAPPRDQVLELVAALYDSGVAYTDAQIARLLRRLRELGLEERTVVVFTSDHGEALGEHGLQGHGYWYDHNLLVPLMIAAPGLDVAGRTVETQVRSIDIAPTLVELAGLAPLQKVDGRSLVPLMRGDDVELDPEAWSYTPKGNWGVTLRRGNELKYGLNDSPWEGLRARESLYRLAEDPAELDDVSAEARETDMLRRRVLQRMSTVPGFRVRLQSAEGERLYGHLRGSPVQPQKLKSLDLQCDCLRWVPPGTVEFEVPEGTGYTLLFHDVPAGALAVEELRIEGRSTSGDPGSVKVDLEDLESPRTLSLAGDEWTLRRGRPAGQATGLTFWWSGDVSVGAADSSAVDPELADQLRALGYVD